MPIEVGVRFQASSALPDALPHETHEPSVFPVLWKRGSLQFYREKRAQLAALSDPPRPSIACLPEV